MPFPSKHYSVFGGKFKPNKIMRKILLLAIMLTAILPLYAQDKLTELRRTLMAHYSDDTEKQCAAEWLLGNMQYYGTVESQLQKEYYKKLTAIERQYKYPECVNHIYTLADSVYAIKDKNFHRVMDSDVITADYLVSYINHAFNQWRNGNFAKHLTFEEFCEWMLPYRIKDENITDWREDFCKKNSTVLQELQSIDDRRYSTYWAATYVNEKLKRDGIAIKTLPHFGGVLPTAKVLKYLRMGDCSDYAFRAALVMRACGIPVSVDFTPQWPTRPHGHHWDVLHDASGRNIPFMGSESNPGAPCKSDYTYGKVYRYTFSYQESSLFHKNIEIQEAIPPEFMTPFIKDVTDEYTKGVTVSGRIHCNKHFAYLAAFNNQGWTPIAWTEINDSKAIFYNVGRGAVYLPIIWDGKAIPATYPLCVKANGEIEELKPDISHKQSITMMRKYPKFNSSYIYGRRMIGGTLSASTTADFISSLQVAEIKRNPEMEYDSVTVNLEPQRYYRYTAPRNSACNVAEIAFYDNNGNKLQPQTVITDGTEDAGFKAEAVIDGDALTYYQTKKSDYATLTFDFGKPVAVAKIKYLPRNDDNHVTAGHRYRLDYYDRDGAHTVGEQTATTDSVTFVNVPTGALYILHDLTKGKEERIFTFENGKVRWW